MMLSKARILILGTVATVVVFIACSKYKDPPPAAPPPDLDNFYCNDSRAVNYNWGFPGIPNNEICIYPIDSFLGTWTFYDTIYLPSGDTASTQIKTLVFTSTEDTVLSHMAVNGWCGAWPLYVTANKYGRAETDTLPGNMPQYLCGGTDTLFGTFTRQTDTVSNNKMLVDLTVNTASGTANHRGIAIKQ